MSHSLHESEKESLVNNTSKALIGLSAAIAITLGAAGGIFYTTQATAFVATVNGSKISTERFNQAMKGYTQQMRMDLNDNSPEGKRQRQMIQQNVVNQLVEIELLMGEAKKRNLVASDKEVNEKLDQVKKQFPDQAKFQEALKQYGLTVDDLKGQIVQGLTLQKLQEDLAKAEKLSDKELREYYDKHIDQFKQSEQASASHILVKEEKLAKEILAKLKKGEDFKKLASQYSTDPGSKAQGGSLGSFGRGMMVPEFEKAAFSLKKGELSGLVKTTFGYHILLGGGTTPARTQSFEEVKPLLNKQLTMSKVNTKFQNWVTDLKKTAKIEIKSEYQAKVEPMLPASPSAATKK